MKHLYSLFLLSLIVLLPAPETALAQDEGLAYNVPILVSVDTTDIELRIGIHPDALNTRDSKDQIIPPPPPGGFDTRIVGIDRNYQHDIRALTEETVEFEISYSAAEGQGPIVLSWDPEALAEIGNFVIVDKFRGGDLFTLDMTTDEDGRLDTSDDSVLEDNLIIRATAIPSTSAAVLSGSVTYFPGGQNAGMPLEGVDLTLGGDASARVVTAADGTYTIEAEAGGRYTLSAAKADDAQPARGVTSRDLSLAQRHVLHADLLDSPYQIIAADVNGSGTVTSRDLSLGQQLVLGKRIGFKDEIASGDGSLWQCVVAGQTFDDPQDPFPFDTARRYTSLGGNQGSQDFHCFRRADVNGSWTPAE